MDLRMRGLRLPTVSYMDQIDMSFRFCSPTVPNMFGDELACVGSLFIVCGCYVYIYIYNPPWNNPSESGDPSPKTATNLVYIYLCLFTMQILDVDDSKFREDLDP